MNKVLNVLSKKKIWSKSLLNLLESVTELTLNKSLMIIKQLIKEFLKFLNANNSVQIHVHLLLVLAKLSNIELRTKHVSPSLKLKGLLEILPQDTNVTLNSNHSMINNSLLCQVNARERMVKEQQRLTFKESYLLEMLVWLSVPMIKLVQLPNSQLQPKIAFCGLKLNN